MQRNRRNELRVGIFVIVALAIGATIVFTLGGRRNLFSSKVDYKAVFDDVGGLQSGSPVRIAGIDVGSVSELQFQQDGRITLTLEITKDSEHLIRRGGIASIANKGMLGDKLIDISVGEGEPLSPGSTIPSDESANLSYYLDKAGRILSDVEGTAHNLNEGTQPFSEPEFTDNVRETSRNLAKVTRMAAENDGTLQRLMTDEELARRIDRTLQNLDAASGELNHTARGMRQIVDEVRHGDGTAHQVIYGDEGTRMMRNFADAAGEVASLLADVRQGDGALHQLVYGSEGNDLVANLTEVSADLKAISSDVRSGRGTIGGLLTDPSIYEDVKRLVGDLRRNEILRALVRYSIRRDRSVEPATVERAERD